MTTPAVQWAAVEKSLLGPAHLAGFSLRRNRGAAYLLAPAMPAMLPRPQLEIFWSVSIMSLETEIQILAAALKGHTAALADLAAAVRAVATGRSLNTTPAGIDQARPADEKAAAPAAGMNPPPAEKQAAEAAPAEQEKTGAPQAKPETETAAAAAGAAAELAAMSPADFMERIRELTQGVPGARDLLARVLKANGWSSFRTLERSDYATAVNAIAAELAGGRA